jgi:hypothetical protein
MRESMQKPKANLTLMGAVTSSTFFVVGFAYGCWRGDFSSIWNSFHTSVLIPELIFCLAAAPMLGFLAWMFFVALTLRDDTLVIPR